MPAEQENKPVWLGLNPDPLIAIPIAEHAKSPSSSRKNATDKLFACTNAPFKNKAMGPAVARLPQHRSCLATGIKYQAPAGSLPASSDSASGNLKIAQIAHMSYKKAVTCGFYHSQSMAAIATASHPTLPFPEIQR
ncbi:hypothetical protein LPJ57_000439 [Coemansia sp. RSA 486]|nr:hypothetical protein LPJ57_000439 [Coemansia sp. RSA 486]KAJ2220388.1 hypothetical protein IWW45_009116 [Coemansia sp. RSA 485]